MLHLEEALERILTSLPPPAAEHRPVSEAAGRVALAPALARIDLPASDNSAMDGYAVRAADVAVASASQPVRLRVIGRVPAGQVFSGEVTSGSCVRLFTGSAMPAGSDAVVMQEDTLPDTEDAAWVRVQDGVKPWENVRFRGEDVKAGAVIAEAGTRLGAAHVGLLAAAGVARVATGRAPRVALLATGSELDEPDRTPAPGRCYESNRVMLAPLVTAAGALPSVSPIVPDDLASTRAALEQAFATSDVIITSGGVSVGECDFVKAAFESIGGRLEFWKVAIRPGKPFVFGRLGDRFLFGLPGNPVSALVTFALLVRPALLRMQGARSVLPRTSLGRLAEPLSNPGERRHFVRVILDGNGAVRPSGPQASHHLGSLALAGGLLDLPPGSNLAPGELVRVQHWD